MTHTPITKKEGKNVFVLLLLLALVFISSCKKVSDATLQAVDAQVDKLKEDAASAVQGVLPSEANQTEGTTPTQTVYLPHAEKLLSSDNVITQSYVVPCKLQKFSILNKYCGFKNYWSKQSTLLSWYLPYWVVLLVLFIAFLVFLWNLWRGRS